MLTLHFFSYSLEATFGASKLLLIYFGSLIGGDLFSLYIHRNDGDYSSVGASGAISGVVFADIVLFLGIEIGFLLLTVSIPSWLNGLYFVLISIYGIKSQCDNIGHEAHLGEGLVGLFIALIIEPDSITVNTLPILFILIPSLVFIYFIITKPEFLLVDNLFQKQ